MPFLQNVARSAYGMFAGLKNIFDSFNRTNGSPLGVADTGQTWTVQRGSWSITDGRAFSGDGNSGVYPLASVNAGTTNVEASAPVGSGVGLSFWVTDSNSWWAVYSYNTTSTVTFQCFPYSCFCFSASGQCVSGPSFGTGGCLSTSFVSDCGGLYNYENSTTCGGSGINNWSCTGSTGTCYETCTSTVTNYYLRRVSSVSGTLSTGTDVSLSSQPYGLKVTTSGNNLTAQAYSNTSLTTTLGSALTETNTGTKGTSVGIMLGASATASNSIDSFTAKI